MKNLGFILCQVLLITVSSGPLLAKGPSREKPRTSKASEPHRPKKPSALDIVRNFTFIGDFDIKDETRTSSHEVFWRYPYTMPRTQFDVIIDHDPETIKKIIPITEGEGRAVEHLNTGRISFMNGNYEEARQTWLGGRARFGKTYPFHRRNDYFIAQAFLYLGYQQWLANGKSYDSPELRQKFVNANSFFSTAFDKKKDLADEVLDGVAPRAYYNQAVILYNYDRWAGASGASTLGLDFLRRTGRTEYRREFRRIMAETFIKSQDYLEAVREIDMTLRQDEAPESAAALFARVGDIYFALNNFELAEEVYEAANRIDEENRQIQPSQYVLRGESLFWLGRFEAARKNFEYALNAQSLPNSRAVLDENMQALASLRIADSYLAEKNMEKAKLAYFTHQQEFRSHVTAPFAKLRLACLELPQYEGNNIKHARELLAEFKDQLDTIPVPAQELAWTCEMASYAQHERTAAMVERVRTFAGKYPESDLLKSLVEPVREVQSGAIQEYFKKNDNYGAVTFFERTRASLYPKVNDSLARQLFVAYVDIGQSAKAMPFAAAYAAGQPDPFGRLRLLVAQAEVEKKPSPSLEKKAEAMLNDSVFFEQGPQVELMISRLMTSPARSDVYPWVLAQSLRWADHDLGESCDRVYPLLQQMPSDAHLSNKLLNDATVFIDRHLKDLYRFETNCAYSLMEFEVSQPKLDTRELIARFMQRDYLPYDAQTVGLLWSLAERAQAAGHTAEARQVWEKIVAKANPSLREVRFAKARLDGRTTELEGLWGP